MKKPKVEVIFDPEQFKHLSGGYVVKYVRNHENTAVVGRAFGVDRHLVKYDSIEQLREYKEHNPYSKE